MVGALERVLGRGWPVFVVAVVIAACVVRPDDEAHERLARPSVEARATPPEVMACATPTEACLACHP